MVGMPNVAIKTKQPTQDTSDGEGFGGGIKRFFINVWRYLNEVWGELKKTSWPSKPELARSTAVVIAAVVIVAIWIRFCDLIMTQITVKILHYF